MVVRQPSALRFVTASLLLGVALTAAASAQDVMQLDLAFKDSLQGRPGSEGAPGYRVGRGQDVSQQGASQGREHIKAAARRHPGRHRHKT